MSSFTKIVICDNFDLVLWRRSNAEAYVTENSVAVEIPERHFQTENKEKEQKQISLLARLESRR